MASTKSPKSTQLPSPPASPPPSDKPTTTTPPANLHHLHDLETALDALLASYLTLLDQYTTLRAELSSHLSSGFLSLAAANRNAASTLGPGRRFGEEGFDGRMRALRRVSITATPQPPHSGEGPETVLEEAAAAAAAAAAEGPESDQEDSSPTPPRISFSIQRHSHDQPREIEEHPQPPPPPRDPLKWYTALPPPALRQTQTHFVVSLEGPLAALLGVQAQMALVEDQVRRARRELEDARAAGDRGGPGVAVGGEIGGMGVQGLALVDDDGEGDGQSGELSELRARQPQAQAKAQKATTAQSSSPPSASSPLKGQLASRSRGGEPRSRVLKMQ